MGKNKMSKKINKIDPELEDPINIELNANDVKVIEAANDGNDANDANDAKDDDHNPFLIKLNEYLDKQKKIYKMVKELKNEEKNLRILYNKERKRKSGKSKGLGKDVRAGITKEEEIPPKLKKILNLNDEKLPRTKIAKKMYEYHQSNGLFDKKDGRILRVNTELAELYNVDMKKVNGTNDVKDKDGVNFFNLQSRIKHLYPNKKPVVKGKDKNKNT